MIKDLINKVLKSKLSIINAVLPLLYILFVSSCEKLDLKRLERVENLTHIWTFEDGTTKDGIGTADGVLRQGATIVDGDLVMSDTGQYMEMPGDVISINSYSEVSVAAWFTSGKLANPSYTMLYYFGGDANGVGGDGFFFTAARQDDKCRAAISCGNYTEPYLYETGVDYLPELDSGNIHHVVSYITATEIGLYIDGEFIGSATLEGNNSIANLSNDRAYLAKGGYFWDPEWIGRIHECSIYDKALSADDIMALYQKRYITDKD
jgi:hypothetical protein